MTVTTEQLTKIFVATPANVINSYLVPLNKVLEKNAITSKLRIAHFLSQTGHESAGFTRIIENLNYSRDNLLRVFPKYFDIKNVDAYAKNPQKIASRVYANRMGNGPEESGDGWKYRGRGVIQLTGKNNYQAFANSVGKTLDTVVQYLETAEGAIASAGWFWNTNHINTVADRDDVVAVTKLINGGTNGLAERKALLAKVKTILV